MKRFRHWLAHRFGWHDGFTISWMDLDGSTWVAFECDVCHRIEGVHTPPAHITDLRVP